MGTKLRGRRHEDVTIETANGIDILFLDGSPMYVRFMPRSEQMIIVDKTLHVCTHNTRHFI